MTVSPISSQLISTAVASPRPAEAITKPTAVVLTISMFIRGLVSS